MLGTWSITDANVHQFQAPGLTLRVRCQGIPQLSLIVPSQEEAFWQLQLPNLAEDREIRLGSLADLPPKLAKKVARALLERPEKTPEDGPTLKKFLKVYWLAHASQLAPGTQLSIKSYSRRLIEAFGNEPLTWICHRAVAAWHADYSRRSPGGADMAKNLLRAVLNQARSWGVLAVNHPNPCEGIPRNRRGPGNRSLSAEELAALGAVLAEEERDSRYRTHARRLKLTLLSGSRPGEIRTLAWPSVVSIDGQPSHVQILRAKTGPRRMELNSDAAAIIASQPVASESGPVFPTARNSRRPYTEGQALRYWHRIVRKADLPEESRQYWLRHTFASNALLAGGTMMAASALLGHVSPATTRRYIHVPSQETLAAGERIGERIAGWLGLNDWLQTPPPSDNRTGPFHTL